eukprot:CCRYP_005250-RA/>CCRYP_005250-RA protein AED:0.02 eAED:0.02 QI:57/1/1/1/0/0/2/210/625
MTSQFQHGAGGHLVPNICNNATGDNMADKRARQLRHRLCAAIALNPTATEYNSSELFRSICDENQAGEHCDASVSSCNIDNSPQQIVCEDSSNVTPLMMACDKCHSAALVYLRNEIEKSHPGHLHANRDEYSARRDPSLRDLVELWGHPTESSSTSEGANSAAHHALAAGFPFGLDVVEYFSSRCPDDFTTLNPKERSKISRLHEFHSLVSQANANGDTPIMMACVFGHTTMIKHVLEKCLELSINALREASSNQLVTLENSSIEELWRPVQGIFAMRNKDGCSALNLSCGHGHVDIVRLISLPLCVKVCWTDNWVHILHENEPTDASEASRLSSDTVQSIILKPLVAISFEDAKFCQESLGNLESELKLMKQEQNRVGKFKLNEFTEQRRKINQCGEILNAELNRMAESAMTELMNDDGEAFSTFLPNRNAAKKKKKKSKGTRKAKQENVPTLTGNEISLSYECTTEGDNERESQTAGQTGKQCTSHLLSNESPFITLHDGSIISKTQQYDFCETVNSEEPLTEEKGGKQASQSLRSVLQSQILRHQHPKEDTPLCDQTGFDIEAKMESLCLDPSMLLLTSHGMAMEMSPCQLEAMQSILEHQFNATIEAQRIQKRLLSARKDE